MSGNVKLMTSAGGGVILDTATTTATDVTVKVPVTGVNNGTLVCSNSSGNVGIGTSSPLEQLHLSRATYPTIRLTDTGLSSNLYLQTHSGLQAHRVIGTGAYPLVFGTNDTERMRIDSSGNLLVGTTGASPFDSCRIAVDASNEGMRMRNTSSSGASSATMIRFLSAANATVGSITATGTATSYATSSDYRLKENITPMANALSVVQQLNPVTYTWKADGSDGQGFIAHELQAVVPDCVTGEKDAVDAEGNPVYQGIDTSFLVATLTKAIQEQQAQIETLTAKVAALEAK